MQRDSQTDITQLMLQVKLIKTKSRAIIILASLFGLTGAQSGKLLETSAISTKTLIQQIPFVIIRVWINLFFSIIGNQSVPESVLEDFYNKPWRPISSGRIFSEQVYRLMKLLYPFSVLVSPKFGGVRPCLVFMGLAYLYNHLGLGDSNALAKNAINACGYLCFMLGATEVASASPSSPLTREGLLWFLLVWMVVFAPLLLRP